MLASNRGNWRPISPTFFGPKRRPMFFYEPVQPPEACGPGGYRKIKSLCLTRMYTQALKGLTQLSIR